MNTKQIDYVIEASDTLNFNQAAENLFVSQPALSYQIRTLELEVNFTIFDRIGKSVRLTPAGKQFCQNLKSIRQQLKESIEQAENFSNVYSDKITISLPIRSCLPNLPNVMHAMQKENPQVLIIPEIGNPNAVADFNDGIVDVLFISKPDVPAIPKGSLNLLYQSPIYLLVSADDPLAKKNLVTIADLDQKTLLVNGSSSSLLKNLQKSVMQQANIHTLNSPNHDFTMITVASGQAVCLSPGYLQIPDDSVVWIPFDTDISYECALLTHKNDNRSIVKSFIKKMISNEKNELKN